MSGKARPSLRKKTLENVRFCNLSQTDKDCIFELFRRYEEMLAEIVLCKDCKHNVANWQHDELDATDYTDIVCDYFMTDGMCPNDFCSYGVRKGDVR